MCINLYPQRNNKKKEFLNIKKKGRRRRKNQLPLDIKNVSERILYDLPGCVMSIHHANGKKIWVAIIKNCISSPEHAIGLVLRHSDVQHRSARGSFALQCAQEFLVIRRWFFIIINRAPFLSFDPMGR
jgi:hypothetical protein